MNCEETRALIGPAIDDELTSADTARLMSHLEQCRSCKQEWDKLMAVREGIKGITQAEPAPADLEKRLLNAIHLEHQRNIRLRATFLLVAAAAVAAFGGGAFLLFAPGTTPKLATGKLETSPRAISSIEKLLATAGHHSETSDDAAITIDYVGHKDAKDLTPLAGFAVKQSTLASSHGTFKLSGSDMLKIGKQNMVRLCYTSDDDDRVNCIDCYQAPEGMLSFAGARSQTINGKTVFSGRIGEDTVLKISENGVDIFYVTPLPVKELQDLIKANV